MKILFFGSTGGTACSLHYFTALVRLGHEVLPFDPEYFRARSTLDRLMIRARKAPGEKRRRDVGTALAEVCRLSRFDAVFVMAENFLGWDTIERVKSQSSHAPLFFYHSHDNNFAPGILKPQDFDRTLAAYDHVFTTKSQNVERHRAAGQPNAHYIPSAYEPTVHRPVAPAESRISGEFDVTFIGTFDRSRLPSLDAVGWDKVRVWGSDWRRWEHYPAHEERVTPRPVYYFEFADILSRSKISLGLLREEAEDRHTQRTFEIPACGALQFAPRNAEILSYFEEDKEIVCFASLDELKDKVRYYLEHDTERRRLAKAGHERCLGGNHTYVDRVAQMLRIAFGENVSRESGSRRHG